MWFLSTFILKLLYELSVSSVIECITFAVFHNYLYIACKYNNTKIIPFAFYGKGHHRASEHAEWRALESYCSIHCKQFLLVDRLCCTV